MNKDEELNEHYAQWRSDPSTDNQTQFFESLFHLLNEKAEHVHSEDGIAREDKAKDAAMDLCVQLMERLTNGEVIDNLTNYAARAWKLTKWSTNRKIVRTNRKFIHPIVSVDGGDGEMREVNLIDKQIVAENNMAPPSIIETEAEYRQRYKKMIRALPAELQDICGLWLQMKTEQDISEALGISTQKVGRLKAKIKKATAAMPANRNRSNRIRDVSLRSRD